MTMDVSKEAEEMIKTTEFPKVTFDDTLVNIDKCPVAKRVLSTKIIQKRDISWDDVVEKDEEEEDSEFYDTLQVILVIAICLLVGLIFCAGYLTLKLTGVI